MSTIVLNFRNYISKLNFKLLSYDKLKYEHDWESIEHSHPYSEILFVTGGHGAFINNGKQRPLSKGNIVITNPYVSHTEISLPPPSKPLEYIVISLDEIYFTPEDAEEIFSDRSYIYNISAHWNEIENFLERIQQEINTEALLWENAVLSIINELLILILRFTNLNNLHTEGTMPTTHSNRIVWLVRQYMEQYYAEPITLNIWNAASNKSSGARPSPISKTCASTAQKRCCSLPISRSPKFHCKSALRLHRTLPKRFRR